MKVISTFHVLVIFTVVLMFSPSFATFAESSFVRDKVIETAKADADKDVNKFVWVGAGCLASGIVPLLGRYGYAGLPLGLLGCHLYQPGPPPSRLVGKSPEYVATYVAAYKSGRGRSQVQLAGMGCLTGTLTLWVILTGGIL